MGRTESLDTLGVRELKELIAKSYELVTAKLPRKAAKKKSGSEDEAIKMRCLAITEFGHFHRAG